MKVLKTVEDADLKIVFINITAGLSSCVADVQITAIVDTQVQVPLNSETNIEWIVVAGTEAIENTPKFAIWQRFYFMLNKKTCQ